MMNAPSSERPQKSLHAARVIREDRVVHREGGSIYPSSASAVICQFELYHRISSGGHKQSRSSHCPLPAPCCGTLSRRESWLDSSWIVRQPHT